MNDGSLSREGLSGDAKVAYSFPDPGWMMGIVGFGPNNPPDPALRVLTFTTEPLAQDLEIAGSIRLPFWTRPNHFKAPNSAFQRSPRQPSGV